jgi:hypothetical protein
MKTDLAPNREARDKKPDLIRKLFSPDEFAKVVPWLMLHREGISCRIYEAASELKPVGVGINSHGFLAAARSLLVTEAAGSRGHKPRDGGIQREAR